jgi:F-type H+-transporting ATPase subunit delta
MLRQGANLFRRTGINAVARRSYAGPVSSETLKFSFVTPYKVFSLNEDIVGVTVPGEEGRFGIKPSHVPIIAQLRPGVIEIERREKNTSFFVGSGFVVVHPDATCNVSVTEAIPVEELDKKAAENGLEEAKRRLTSVTTDSDKAEAQIAIETFEALIAAA